MKPLGIDDFFYVPDRSYDFLAEKSLPYYHEAHAALISSLCYPTDASLDIVDLGIGSGVTSAYILKNYPNARIMGVDLFDAMLDDARARLQPFSDRVTLVRSDNTEFLRQWQGKAHAIVSAFCIHHLDEPGKKELFKLVHDRLHPGGRFLMLDLTTFNEPCLKELARAQTIEHMKGNVLDEQYRAQWIHHWNNINIPHPADAMVAWLNEMDLAAELVFRSYEVALIAAQRPHQQMADENYSSPRG
jgi:tRNA (cmo5U34)-methyltransferase